VEEWDPPITGSQTASLVAVRVVALDGLTTSAGGTHLLYAKKVTHDGTPTLVELLDTSVNLKVGGALTDKVLKTLTPTADELAPSLATRTFSVGQSLRMGGVSNNADLTGGAGGYKLVPIWEILS
jgi:hypothetical protein